jgi:outer membrane protein insertion porin family
VTADISALQAVYQNNGFSKVRITPETSAGADESAEKGRLRSRWSTASRRASNCGWARCAWKETITWTRQACAQLNTVAGQLLSPQNLAGDRDALLTDYMSRGFDQVRVEVAQQIEPADASKVDVVFHITEGGRFLCARCC